MSKFLIQKTALTVEPILAVKVGLNEAIFLKQLHYWLNRTKHIKKIRNGFLTRLKSGISSYLFFLKRQFHELLQI